jgi:hypothetical protein
MHCRTLPADLATSSHLHMEPSGQVRPSHQSPCHKPLEARAICARFRNRRHMPVPGPANDARRAASSGSPRHPGWSVRTRAVGARGTGRRTSCLDRRGTVGSGRGAAAAGWHTGLGGARRSSWPRWKTRIRPNFVLLRPERCRSRRPQCGLLAGGQKCREC